MIQQIKCRNFLFTELSQHPGKWILLPSDSDTAQGTQLSLGNWEDLKIISEYNLLQTVLRIQIFTVALIICCWKSNPGSCTYQTSALSCSDHQNVGICHGISTEHFQFLISVLEEGREVASQITFGGFSLFRPAGLCSQALLPH